MKKTIRVFKETVEMRSSLFNRIRTHRYFPISLLIAAILLASFVHVWQRVRVMELVHDIAILRQDNADLVDDTKKVYSDVARLSLSSRIQAYAADSLGMRVADADRLFTLIRDEAPPVNHDDLSRLMRAVERLAEHVPVVAETRATAGEVTVISLDTLLTREDGR